MECREEGRNGREVFSQGYDETVYFLVGGEEPEGVVGNCVVETDCEDQSKYNVNIPSYEKNEKKKSKINRKKNSPGKGKEKESTKKSLTSWF